MVTCVDRIRNAAGARACVGATLPGHCVGVEADTACGYMDLSENANSASALIEGSCMDAISDELEGEPFAFVGPQAANVA